MTTEKFCTKCGKKFLAVGREVICPACKDAAADDAKRAAVLKAKRASWAGESVPVRISGRASTVIRRYGAANNLPFAAALDALLKASDYFKSTGGKWEDITPYKSRRRVLVTTETAQDTPQDTPQDTSQDTPQDTPQDTASKPQDVRAAKESKTVKETGKAASKTNTAKTASKK